MGQATVTNVSSTTGDGSYKEGETIAIKITFSENVTVTGTPQLTLETGGSDAVVNYSSGTGTTNLIFNYTIADGHTASDLDFKATSSLTLPAPSPTKVDNLATTGTAPSVKAIPDILVAPIL